MGLWTEAVATAGKLLPLDQLAIWSPHAEALRPGHPDFEE